MDPREAEKRAAARAALAYVEPGALLGVGSGSTVAHFIDALAGSAVRPAAAVAASRDTEEALVRAGITVIALDDAERPLSVYVDGADEVERSGRAIKGGGGAHAREKLIAKASSTWVCIVDESKLVERLGESAPVPLEVVPELLPTVLVSVATLGGEPRLCEGRLADSGDPLVDVHGLDLADPVAVEDALEAIPGVVACGVFARRRADVVLVGRADGSVETIVPIVADGA